MSKKQRVLVSLIIVPAALGLMAAKPDRERLRQIRTVAVVGLQVPWTVESAATGSGLGLATLVEAIKSFGEEEEFQGNGDEVAQHVLDGFLRELSSSGVFEVLPREKVTRNLTVQEMLERQDRYGRPPSASPEGFPFLPTARLETAARTLCEALAVDAVLVLDFDSLYYDIYGGINETGAGKAYGRAQLWILDSSGEVLWRFRSTVQSRESASMIAGDILPDSTEELERSLGAAWAEKLIEKYRKVLR